MARDLLFDPDAAARTAKNEIAASGLPIQTARDSKGVLMVTQRMVVQAAERTGYRPGLVEAPMTLIVSRDAKGESVKKIVARLRYLLGPDCPVATAEFVRWVLAEAGRGGR